MRVAVDLENAGGACGSLAGIPTRHALKEALQKAE
jgi:hypothetical protein